VFFGGLASAMAGTKATYLQSLCSDNNISFIKFDYFGHGESSGELKDGNITLRIFIWRFSVKPFDFYRIIVTFLQ
jgi:hypothetical protein